MDNTQNFGMADLVRILIEIWARVTNTLDGR